MATNRRLVFINSYIYHVFNRGVERRTIFSNQKDYQRFLNILNYYFPSKVPIRFSKFASLPPLLQQDYRKKFPNLPTRIDLLAFCLMPNHFHLLVQQTERSGVTKFMSDISNSYARYFNTKYKREGPLFQGPFKAVLIETDEQLMHISRYIHLNPFVSALVNLKNIHTYPWSSLQNYMGKKTPVTVKSQKTLSYFPSPKAYMKFVEDQADYAKELHEIKHLTHDAV